MAKRKKSEKIPLPIMIIICAVLLYAFYSSVSTLALAIWGDSAMGTVDSYGSRLDDSKAEPNRSRTITKGYWFIADGKQYRGYSVYKSDEAWSSLKDGETRSERIRYLEFFPYVNKPAMLCDFNKMGDGAIIYHILAPFGCLFLLLLVIRSAGGGKKKKKKSARTAAESATHGIPQITETRSETDMFCHNCGQKLPEGAAFCSSCGTKILAGAPNVCTACGAELPEGAEFCISCGKAVNPAATEPARPGRVTASAPAQGGAGLVGFSERYRDPEILEAARENKKFAVGCLWVLVLLPLLGMPVAGLLVDDLPFGEAVIIGCGIAFVMLILNLIALRSRKQPMWEGVVVKKYSKVKYEHRDSSETYMEFTVVIRTDAGRKKTIGEGKNGRRMYDYFSVGDRVRYHPLFGTYEKYDKSKDRIIYCNVCTMMNPIQNDRCNRCNNLLFK
jgi:ribosomal protein L40E